MALTPIQKIAYKYLGKYARKYCASHPEIEESLMKAGPNYRVRPEPFVASFMLYSLICIGAGFGIAAFVNIAFGLPSPINILVWIGAPVGLPTLVFLIGPKLPTTTASGRGRDIDAKLAYAVNYMAAMASADVNPNVIFRGLSGQKIYGEIAYEAAMIARDIDILNKDLITVLKEAVYRSPSIKFSEFLQGIVTTIGSGGSLKLYFHSKADQYMKENRVEQHGTLETLGVMGESFVTVVVAAPLFLIVMMSVMAMMGNGDTTILYIIIFLMIPLAQFLFVFIIGGMKLGD